MSTKINTLGTNVRRLRTNLHLTQQKLGEKLFHEKTWVSKVESGHLIPSSEDLLRIAQIFHCDPSELEGLNSASNLYALHNQTLKILTALETRIEITNETIQKLEADCSALNNFSSFFSSSLQKHFLVLLIEKLGISQTTLAKRLGISVSYISKLISNNLPISEKLAERIAPQSGFSLSFKGFSTPKEFLDFYEKDLAECRLNLIKLRDSLHEEKITLTASDETLIKMSFDSENSDN